MFDSMQAEPPDRSRDRWYRPPRQVWISLAKLFPCDNPTPYPQGWDTQAQVPGELHAWARATTGQWIALVQYRMNRGSERTQLTHWVPAVVVSLRQDQPARKEPRSGRDRRADQG